MKKLENQINFQAIKGFLTFVEQNGMDLVINTLNERLH